MEIFRQTLGDIVGGSVLDVATQRGGFVQILTENLQSYTEITGIDISEEAIAAAQNTFDQENIQFIQMDAGQLNFADARFNTVSLSASLHHMVNIPQVLAEAMRVLKPGGHFILAEMHREGQTEAQLTRVYIHHWAAAVDTALGIPHNKTLTRQEFVDYMAELALSDVVYHDFSDTESDPMDEEMIASHEEVIEKYIQRIAGTADYATLKQQGEALRQRLRAVGVQSEPILVIVGRKI